MVSFMFFKLGKGYLINFDPERMMIHLDIWLD